MLGDTPQPAETPRDEGNPWSFPDPDPGWWRGETDRSATEAPEGPSRNPRRRTALSEPAQGGTGILVPPESAARQHTGAAAEAHAAAARDVAEELDPAARQRTEPPIVERDHDRPDPHRYDPLRPPGGQPAQQAAAETATEPAPTEPVAPEQTGEPGTEPDVMVLPEPNTRNRPTVPLDRRPVPGLGRQSRGRHHPTEPLPRPTGSPRTDARLERLENSPFWQTDPEQPTDPRVPARPARTGTRHGTRRANRRPASALFALVVLGLVAAFFAWVSAEPFWLALGHGDRGYATTTHCTGSGVTQRCTGRFAAADGDFTISRVALLGVDPVARVPGTITPARMVSPDSRRAYLGDTDPLVQLRWILGFALVLICGYAIAGLTGARRLETARARRSAVLLSLAGPLLLLGGFLIAAY